MGNQTSPKWLNANAGPALFYYQHYQFSTAWRAYTEIKACTINRCLYKPCMHMVRHLLNHFIIIPLGTYFCWNAVCPSVNQKCAGCMQIIHTHARTHAFIRMHAFTCTRANTHTLYSCTIWQENFGGNIFMSFVDP